MSRRQQRETQNLSRGLTWVLVARTLADHFDPFEQQVELPSVDLITIPHGEGPGLQALVQEPEPVTLPDQQLHSIAATTVKANEALCRDCAPVRRLPPTAFCALPAW